jgi:3-methyladenine DNA glycosylase Tag
MYALMQAAGMVDDHLEGCFRATAVHEAEPAAVAT